MAINTKIADTDTLTSLYISALDNRKQVVKNIKARKIHKPVFIKPTLADHIIGKYDETRL